MPSSKKSPSDLVACFDEHRAIVPRAVHKQMFGYPRWVFGGNMFMCLIDYLVLRLSEPDRAELSPLPHLFAC
ncbi:MAG: hypothetical protein ABSD85_09330 [Acidimicrobiales bacterium]|jgi:hypothetical protein